MEPVPFLVALVIFGLLALRLVDAERSGEIKMVFLPRISKSKNPKGFYITGALLLILYLVAAIGIYIWALEG